MPPRTHSSSPSQRAKRRMNTCTLKKAPPATTQPEGAPLDTSSELPLGHATGVPDEPPATRDDTGGGPPHRRSRRASGAAGQTDHDDQASYASSYSGAP